MLFFLFEKKNQFLFQYYILRFHVKAGFFINGMLLPCFKQPWIKILKLLSIQISSMASLNDNGPERDTWPITIYVNSISA